MAASSGQRPTGVSERLTAKGHRFDFFQAVRLAEAAAREAREQGTEAPHRPVGSDYLPAEEAVRFRTLASHTFPAGAIDDVRALANDGTAGPFEMLVTFMGLTGPVGVLPQHYTAMVIERVRNKDFALQDFLDLFNHRMISLFFRAWEKYRFPIGYERSRQNLGPQQDDPFTHALYCLVGLGTAGLRGRQAFDDEALLFYAGHFAHQPRCPVALEILLRDYFGVPVAIHSFQGRWLWLGEENRSRLAASRGANNGLGSTLVLGERVWDVQGMFRVRLGPLNYAWFQRLMPDGDALAPLCDLVRLYAGPEFDFDVQPVLAADEVPVCTLTTDDADSRRLGWNTWLHSGEMPRDADDAVFSDASLKGGA
jgi:type VI secretion system protein ImpH